MKTKLGNDYKRIDMKVERDFHVRLSYFSKEHRRSMSDVIRTAVEYYILLTEQKESEIEESQKKLIEKMVRDDINKLNQYHEKHPGKMK